MSTEHSSPIRALDTRFSTPVPELDDHRYRFRARETHAPKSPRELSPKTSVAHNLNVPSVELHQPLTSPITSGNLDLLRIDESLRNVTEPAIASRDFEHVIIEPSDDDNDVGVTFGEDRLASHRALGRRSSAFRDNRRTRRSLNPADRSRDTSSSRSTSPANSVEAFAAPPRRGRANTLDSRQSVDVQRPRRLSGVSGPKNRPALSHVNVPVASAQRTNDLGADDLVLDVDEEPGKTYKIDFEELEEFVALSGQTFMGQHSTISDPSTIHESIIFSDLRQGEKYEVNNIALNSETFYEQPVPHKSSITKLPTGERLLRQKVGNTPNRPNRFSFFSSEFPTSKKAAVLGDLVADGNTFRDLFDLGPDGGAWWLDVQNPTSAELEVIAKAFKIHRLTKEDIETQEAREKVELFQNYYFVCFRTFNPDKNSDDFLDPVPVYIVVTTDGVLSFSYNSNPHASNVRRRIAKLGDFVSLGPDYICYAMIDDIVDSFAPIIREAETESEHIEDQVFTAREEDFILVLRQIAECRKRVLNMMRLLGGKADVIKGFAKRCNEQYGIAPRGDIGLYLGDIQDHVVTMMSNLGHVERLLSRSHGNYLAQLNVDHIMKGNHTNKALAKITVLASVIVPMNIVTGLFGMNVHIPGQGQMDDGYAWFLGIVGVLLAFAVCALGVAKKLHYI